MVYPEIGTCIIEPWREIPGKTDKYGIPKHWKRIVSMDFGLRNPTVFNFFAIDPEKGEVILYNEYYASDRTIPEHVVQLKPLLDEIPHGMLDRMVADPSITNKTQAMEKRSVADLYAEYDIFWEMGNNNIDAGILKINSYINRGKFKVFRTCVNFLREAFNYKYPELDIDDDKNLDEKPVKKDDHSMDATRYAFMLLPDNPDELKAVAFVPKHTYNSYRMVENEYGWDDSLREKYGGSDLAYGY